MVFFGGVKQAVSITYFCLVIMFPFFCNYIFYDFLSEKTVEGTAAGITSVLAACSALLPLLAATGHMFTQVYLCIYIFGIVWFD